MKTFVKCKTCGTVRNIIRKQATARNYSFYCVECRKEVAQDLDFLAKQIKKEREV